VCCTFVFGTRASREGKGTGEGAAAQTAPKPTPAPQRVVMCNSCKVEPAKRRCAASKWEAVCEACAVRMETAAAAAAAVPAAGSAPEASGGECVLVRKASGGECVRLRSCLDPRCNLCAYGEPRLDRAPV
jgi:hypothetical protein